MAEKRPPLPVILTANDLLTGATIYWTGAGWSPAIDAALVTADEEDAQALEAKRALSEASGETVEPYLATARHDGGHVKPAHYREKIRIVGPTFRDDFGRAGTETI